MEFLKRNRKIVIAITAIFILAILAFLLMEKFNRKNSLFNKQMQLAQEMEAKYKNDTYGGSTPEETLQLFIDALKKGDTELASKYFIEEKQEEMRNDLAIGKSNGGIEMFLKYLDRPRNGKETFKGNYIFTYTENDKILMTIDLNFNSAANIWKIESL